MPRVKKYPDVNMTKVLPNKETIDVLKEFILKHIYFPIPKDTSYEDLSEIQSRLRGKLKTFIKERLNYLKNINLKSTDFYALFVLIIVIDEIKIFSDNWVHINQMTKVNYNPQNRISTNAFNFSLIDAYFTPEDIIDPSLEVNCCCGQEHCRARKCSIMTNGKHTFILGSQCIQKTSIEYYSKKMSTFRKLEKIRKDRELHVSEGGRFCLDCPRKLPLDWTTSRPRCLDCWRKFMNIT